MKNQTQSTVNDSDISMPLLIKNIMESRTPKLNSTYQFNQNLLTQVGQEINQNDEHESLKYNLKSDFINPIHRVKIGHPIEHTHSSFQTHQNSQLLSNSIVAQKTTILLDFEKNNDFYRIPFVLEKYLVFESSSSSIVSSQFINGMTNILYKTRIKEIDLDSAIILFHAKMTDILTFMDWLSFISMHHSNYIREQFEREKLFMAFKNRRRYFIDQCHFYAAEIERSFGIEHGSVLKKFSFQFDPKVKNLPLFLYDLINNSTIYDVISSLLISEHHMKISQTNITNDDLYVQKTITVKRWNEFISWIRIFLNPLQFEDYKSNTDKYTIKIVKYFESINAPIQSYNIKVSNNDNENGYICHFNMKKQKLEEKMERTYKFSFFYRSTNDISVPRNDAHDQIEYLAQNKKEIDNNMHEDVKFKKCCEILNSLRFTGSKKKDNDSSKQKKSSQNILLKKPRSKKRCGKRR